MIFLVNDPLWCRLRLLLLEKLTITLKKKRTTDLATKKFLNLSLLNVNSVRNKCCHPRDFVKGNSIDILCMSSTWLYENDSAIISALEPEYHVLHHVPRPDEKGGGVGCPINE